VRSTDGGSDPMDRIETDRLIMRPLSEDDVTLYCDLYGDPHTMHFVGPPLSRERAERSFRIVLASLDRRRVGRLSLAIIEKATQQAIGIGGYRDFDARRRRVEAGMILKPESCGLGFGKEGLGALVTHAFAVFPVDEVWIQYAAENQSARRVRISLGFSHGTDAAASDGRPGQCFWSAYRQSWRRSPGFAPVRAAETRKVDKSAAS
jgi:ribosomal-protein-alanine N-acetyltransferase